MAAALVGMVARLTLGKKKYADVEGKMEALAAKADAARAELEAAVREDSEAFEGVLRAARLPKATPDQAAARARAVEAATVEAGRVPLRVGRLSADVLEWAAEAAAHGNVNAMSDAASAAALARAALTAAAWNVRVNSKGLGDRSVAEEWSTELRAFEARAAQAEASVRASMGERAGLGQERSAP
jgi:glutamate formiminotransferase/formiminotetrahydrofolate cyclodeaminase